MNTACKRLFSPGCVLRPMALCSRLPDMPAPNDGGSTPVVVDGRYILVLGSSQQVTKRHGKSKGQAGTTDLSENWSGWGDDVFCLDTHTMEWTRPGLLLYVRRVVVAFSIACTLP